MTPYSNDKLKRCHESFTARILAGIKADLVLYLSLSNKSLDEVLSELSGVLTDSE